MWDNSHRACGSDVSLGANSGKGGFQGMLGKEYRGADKSLPRPTSRCTLFDGENISFDASLVIYV